MKTMLTLTDFGDFSDKKTVEESATRWQQSKHYSCIHVSALAVLSFIIVPVTHHKQLHFIVF